MHTKDFLAQELRAAGLEGLAKRAEAGEFHDFLSEHAMPETVLATTMASSTPLARKASNGRPAPKGRRRSTN